MKAVCEAQFGGDMEQQLEGEINEDLYKNRSAKVFDGQDAKMDAMHHSNFS